MSKPRPIDTGKGHWAAGNTRLRSLVLAVAALLTTTLVACGGAVDSAEEPATGEPAPEVEPVAWALAIHGGAGVIPEDMPLERRQNYIDGLREALELGRDLLEAGEPSLDVVQQVVAYLEDRPEFNAGKGAVFTNAGVNELDASIMDGRDLNCGSVAGVTTVKNPVYLARHVMDDSRHVFFLGEGAEAFADRMGVERVEGDYFHVERRWNQLQEALAREAEEPPSDGAAEGPAKEKYGTVGAVALDREGNLAAATSTGGMTNKRFGRVGDVPVIGAGTYADNRTAAVSCTGWGEKFIRRSVAHDVSARIAYKGIGVEQAAQEVIHGELDPEDGGLIAVGRDGAIAMEFNSEGMFRGAADANGRFELGIWGDLLTAEEIAVDGQ